MLYEIGYKAIFAQNTHAVTMVSIHTTYSCYDTSLWEKYFHQINNISILSIYSTIKEEVCIIKSNLFSLKAFCYIILCNVEKKNIEKLDEFIKPLRSLAK